MNKEKPIIIDNEDNNSDNPIMESSSNSVIEDIIHTETEMTQRTLQLLKSRYQKEKENWMKIYSERDTELASLRAKLSDTENMLKQLQGQFSEIQLREIEKLKIYVQEKQVLKQKDEEKWKSIEEQIKLFKQITEDSQNKFGEEQKNYIKLKESYTQKESALRKIIEQEESELHKLRENLASKEQIISINIGKHESEILKLEEQIQKMEKEFHEEKSGMGKTIENNNTDINKLQEALQNITIKLNEEKHKQENLLKELSGKDRQIQELEHKNKSIIEQNDEEQKKIKETRDKEKTEWEKDKHDAAEHEQQLQSQANEQIVHVKSMVDSLETQLKIEKDTKNKLEKQISDNNIVIQVLQQEKLKLEQKAQQYENISNIDKQEIKNKYDSIVIDKEKEIEILKKEIQQLTANIKEQEQIYALEKQNTNKLAQQLEVIQEEKQRLSDQYEQEQQNWKKMVTQEQLVSDKQIEDLRNYIQNLQESHKNGFIDMEGHITVANGELSELRSLYQNLKIENNQQKKRIIELEIELKKTYEQWEKERNEWKSLLASEQENWDKRRVELISREMSLRKTIEEQMVNLENTIDSSTKKLFENEKNMQDRNSELAMLREKNTDLEQKLRNESCFSNEYKTKYDKIYESLIDERKQNVKLAEEINELKMKLNTPSKK